MLADGFDNDCARLIGFLARLEANHAEHKAPNIGITLTGLELAYELAYLKVFLLWEHLLESVFLRLLCGYSSSLGVETPAAGLSFSKTLDAARIVVLGTRDYVMWHNPEAVRKRAEKFFLVPGGHFRQVILASEADLKKFAEVRHRIAHVQDHAQAQFDTATMDLAGKRYPASSAGRFLRDEVAQAHGVRWLNHIQRELSTVAHQLC